jgi:hypothetical protein
VPAALPHPTSPYKGEETASGEGVKPVHEESGLGLSPCLVPGFGIRSSWSGSFLCRVVGFFLRPLPHREPLRQFSTADGQLKTCFDKGGKLDNTEGIK